MESEPSFHSLIAIIFHSDHSTMTHLASTFGPLETLRTTMNFHISTGLQGQLRKGQHLIDRKTAVVAIITCDDG